MGHKNNLINTVNFVWAIYVLFYSQSGLRTPNSDPIKRKVHGEKWHCYRLGEFLAPSTAGLKGQCDENNSCSEPTAIHFFSSFSSLNSTTYFRQKSLILSGSYEKKIPFHKLSIDIIQLCDSICALFRYIVQVKWDFQEQGGGGGDIIIILHSKFHNNWAGLQRCSGIFWCL